MVTKGFLPWSSAWDGGIVEVVNTLGSDQMRSYRGNLGIIVGLDGSSASKAAAEWAARDAQLRSLPLTLVHVAPSWAPWRPQRARRIIDETLDIVDDTSGRGAPPTVSTVVAFANPVATLARLSADAEMVVVGSRRKAWWRGLYPSVSSGILRRSQCPVAIVHHGDPQMHRPENAPVLVRYGGSVGAALLAQEEASRRGVELVISDENVSRLIEQSNSAQLAIIGGWDHVGASVAHAAHTPVVVAS